MTKLALPILAAVLLLAACDTLPRDRGRGDDFDEISREIQRLKGQATPEGNIRIEVTMLTANLSEYTEIDTLWRYVDDHLSIGNRRGRFARSGLKIGLATENFKVRLDIAAENLKESEETQIFLILADGATGYINIGKEIVIPRFYYHRRWYSRIEYEFIQAGRSIQVTAHKLPDGSIKMQLVPVFSKFLNDGGSIELTELATTIIAKPGQTVVIGSLGTSGENVATALLGYQKDRHQKQTLITVTPYF